MPLTAEGTETPRLMTAREPVGPKNTANSKAKSVGDQAVTDSLMLIGAAWVVLLFLYFSLRRYNV